jgi:hypothetical protein
MTPMNAEVKPEEGARVAKKRLREHRGDGSDCVAWMKWARRHPDVLANALREMGVTENGDDLPDEL